MNGKKRPQRSTGKSGPNGLITEVRSQSGGLWAKLGLALAAILLIAIMSAPEWISSLYPLSNQEVVFASAEKHDVDPFLVFAIIRAESGGEANACSPVGARGMMQLMPDTAEWIASQMGRTDYRVEQLNDPAVNIEMGCWYLKHLDREFHGNDTAVIAAYNAGITTVQEWIENGQWDGSAAHIDSIPYPETREYVYAVQSNYSYYRKIYIRR